MLGVALRKLVTLPAPVLGVVCDLLEKLADPEWVEALKRFLRKETPWEAPVTAAKDVLLKLVSTVSLLAIKEFSAQAHFQVGETEGVKVGWLGDNFKRVFGDKVEKNAAGATLKIHTLLKGSTDTLIIAELGGEAVAETTLAQMWEMLKAQGRGQKGKLLVNGYANIFYIRDAQGTLWAVRCGWRSDYAAWDVLADPVTRPNGWGGGVQVVSR